LHSAGPRAVGIRGQVSRIPRLAVSTATLLDLLAVAGPTTGGRRLGRYHLGDPLGGGPCGAVYRAKVYGVAGFERQFAVKRFHPDLVSMPIVSQRLSAAARAYGSLEHPRIARLHEYGIAGGEVFTATEMVPGLDCMRLVAATHGAGSPLPPGAALALVSQVARAVGYAHGRGVNHLGLCPTNVIVTPDGDVKITDVGVFAQTLTMRPSDDERLAVRIHYLAPEQMINETSSAATDVFALGALMHELVTGERAFVGVTTLDVEHAILSGHVRESGLPKAMARVLARCFARSPFERFPDARALADAIDAALRVSPVVGGRRELAQIVKEAVARLDAMNDGQLSGAMVLAMPMAPAPAQTRMATESAMAREIPTGVHQRPTLQGGMEPLAAVAPPKVPPRRISPPTRPPPIVPAVPMRQTKLSAVPPVPGSRDEDESQERTFSRDPAAPRQSAAPPDYRTDLAAPHASRPTMMPSEAVPEPPQPQRMPNASPPPFNAQDAEESAPPERRSNLRLDSAWPTGDHMAIPDGAAPLADGMRPSEPFIEMIPDDDSEGVPVIPEVVVHAPPPAPVEVAVPPHRFQPDDLILTAPVPTVKKKSSGAVWTVFFMVLCAAVGIGGVLAWNKWLRNGGGTTASAGPKPNGDKTPEKAPDKAPDKSATTGTKPVDKAGDKPTDKPTDKPSDQAVVQTADAGATKPTLATAGDEVDAISSADDAKDTTNAGKTVDAGAKAAEPPPSNDTPPAGDGGPLVIESDPAGALVYVDGAEQGKTPAHVASSADTHSIAVFLPGYELYTGDIPGSGTQKVKLTKAVPTEGNGGIKILCKDKKRYYVTVDGHGTGQLCPTERIGVKLGTYQVEIYDFVTESRKTYSAKVTGTGASRRIRVD
jgi:hypothetical protein